MNKAAAFQENLNDLKGMMNDIFKNNIQSKC